MADKENPENPTAIIHTNKADITPELFEQRAP